MARRDMRECVFDSSVLVTAVLVVVGSVIREGYLAFTNGIAYERKIPTGVTRASRWGLLDNTNTDDGIHPSMILGMVMGEEVEMRSAKS